ncbi:MAG TPA: alkaline phosphatase family protein [Vicinamibacteria bacterium]|nr:alkaline phosphatase family protein [Vicinamibacteria bacterium]
MTLPSQASRLSLALVLLAPLTLGGDAPDRPARPGPAGQGVTLLPNGWRIAPVGRHLDAGDLPLAMALHPDGRHLVVTNNGWSKPSLRVVDIERWQVIQKLPLDHAWLGLVWHPDGRRLFSSGAADNSIREIKWRDGKLAPGRTFVLAPPQKSAGGRRLENPGFVGGLALSPDGRTLYAAHVYGESLAAVDVETGRVLARAALPAEAYGTLVSPDGRTVFVSVWGASRVALFEPLTLRPLREIVVGEHPNAMVLSRDGARLFVACANTNAVWAVDLASGKAVEQVGVALRPDAPPGATPNALALSPDGETLLVANADNNTVAVVDVRRPGESRPLGFIPTGWYPTGAAFDPSGRRVLVLSGKGLAPAANPRGPQPVSVPADAQYIGGLLNGALTVLPRPDEDGLRQLTDRVYSLSASSAGGRRAPAERPQGSPVTGGAGAASPIKYVFYVIRENRTYDQVFGDLPAGNGDPNLALFGEEVTPNAHALASEFVLFDNFYVDSEVSHDGHSYSTAAYATDANEKLWPTSYGGRGGLYLAEGEYRMRNAYGNLTAPARGYLWDFAARAGVSLRSYGEFAAWDAKGGPVRASVPGLEGKVHPSFPPFDLTIPDNDRVDVWLEEFRRFEKEGGLPRLNIVHLGGDHTAGTQPGERTPVAMVAENDVALGRMVEAISHSRYWPESAIFVLEDDAQNGPDHVDAHRSVLLLVSPWARRGAVDSTLYTTSGVLRTIELVLGLPPMSQYDAAATPLYAAFAARPDPAPYSVRPARVDVHQRNRADAPGAQASLRMDLTKPDLAPELELNEIVWKSVHGAAAVMPPPIRAAFVRPIADGEEEEEASP